MGFPSSSGGKASACSAGDQGLIPGLGRCPGKENGNPLQFACLENSRGFQRILMLQSMELQGVRHDSVTNTHTLKDRHNWNLSDKKKSPKIFIVDLLVLLYFTIIFINKGKQ